QLKNVKTSGLLNKLLDVDEDDRKNETGKNKRTIEVLDSVMKLNRDSRDNLLKEKGTLRADRLKAKQRIRDVDEKMKKALENVNLLIIPRFTIMNAARQKVIPNRLHRL